VIDAGAKAAPRKLRLDALILRIAAFDEGVNNFNHAIRA
jgi:hypothetical protein